jgi:serine O-acetyltransferase
MNTSPLPFETATDAVQEPPERFWPELREDLGRYLPAGPGPHGLRTTLVAMTEYGFIATAIYRYGRLCGRIRPRWLSMPPKLLYHVLRIFSELGLGIYITSTSRIGPGLHIGHYGGIILSCTIGRRCSIAQGVTVGYKGAGRSTHPPRVGDDVYIGAGAVVIGDISVGDGSIIGANTTVVKDVPPRHRVVSAAVRMSPLEPLEPLEPLAPSAPAAQAAAWAVPETSRSGPPAGP